MLKERTYAPSPSLSSSRVINDSTDNNKNFSIICFQTLFEGANFALLILSSHQFAPSIEQTFSKIISIILFDRRGMWRVGKDEGQHLPLRNGLIYESFSSTFWMGKFCTSYLLQLSIYLSHRTNSPSPLSLK